MDEQTAFVLALQILSLFSIAGALLLYLLFKIQKNEPYGSGGILGASKPVLVTCADNAIGLQISIHLANRGFRVFSGLKGGSGTGAANDTTAARVIRSWQKTRESQNCTLPGSIVALPLDVTREDSLHEAADIVRGHLPAGEDGLWAIINTAGLIYKGRLDQQDVTHWDAMFKTNVLGIVRSARAFQGLLRKASGRILTVGPEDCIEGGLVVYAATRSAVKGASDALRKELEPIGIRVTSLEPQGLSPRSLYVIPQVKTAGEGQVEVSIEDEGCLEYYPKGLTEGALCVLDTSITSTNPQEHYILGSKNSWTRKIRLV